MLFISIPEIELFDESVSHFVKTPSESLLLEHSLASLSKWESIHEKPFLDGVTKTTEQTESYIHCMNLAPVSDMKVYSRISNEDHKQIATYIQSKQTATWFKPAGDVRPSTEIITSEIIYYWMIAHNIPLEAEYWHLERLLTLIKVCNEKNKPATKSKMGTKEQAASRSMLNRQRKAKTGTTG